MQPDIYAADRRRMVDQQIVARGIRDPAVLQAMLNVWVRYANGTLGWPEQAPFDGIVVTASGPRIPQALKAQLATGGRLVMPVEETPDFQQLIRLTRTSDTEFQQEDLGAVAFVPLIGEQGWKTAREREGQRAGESSAL